MAFRARARHTPDGGVMTTLEDVATKKKATEQSAEQKAAVELVRLAQEQGLSLTGPPDGRCLSS
jgi:hypothetical protein